MSDDDHSDWQPSPALLDHMHQPRNNGWLLYPDGQAHLVGDCGDEMAMWVKADGDRISGGTSGASIGHVSPEAAAGGAIALVRDGDLLTYDMGQRTIALLVPADELADRRASWKPPTKVIKGSWLRRYQAMATSADTGGVLRIRD